MDPADVPPSLLMFIDTFCPELDLTDDAALDRLIIGHGFMLAWMCQQSGNQAEAVQ